MNDQFPNASGVLNQTSLSALLANVGRQGQLAIDSLAATNPQQVKEWQADGSLIRRAIEMQDQADEAQAAYQQAKQDNPTMPALAPHEINEIYGGPSPSL